MIHRGDKLIPGARRFVEELKRSGRRYIFLNNSAERSSRGLRVQLLKLDVDIPTSAFLPVSDSIVGFLTSQRKSPSVFLIGSTSLRSKLAAAGVRLVSRKVEYVLVGSGEGFTKKNIDLAIGMVLNGSKLITANGEAAGITENGLSAGCGALVAPIERATGCKAYVVGKPNHLMVRSALAAIESSPENCLIIGDGFDTDIRVGFESGMKTVLVLSGITKRSDIPNCPYQPDYVFEDVGKISPDKLP